jgi:hypothetical protein
MIESKTEANKKGLRSLRASPPADVMRRPDVMNRVRRAHPKDITAETIRRLQYSNKYGRRSIGSSSYGE